MIEEATQTPAAPQPEIHIKQAEQGFGIELKNCTPPQAIAILLDVVKMMVLSKPQPQRPSLLVPNGRPLPNLRM